MTTPIADIVAGLWPFGLPSSTPDAIERTMTGHAQIALHGADVARCDVLHWLLAGGIWSTVFLYFPTAKPTSRALVYCAGHSQDWSLNWITVGEALRRGVIVAEIWISGYLSWPPHAQQMPMTYTAASGATATLTVHDDYALVDAIPGEPASVRLFLDPVVRTIGYLQDHVHASSIALAGHSGGGWESLIVGALDPRPALVVSIHGWCKIGVPGDPGGDYEQRGGRMTTALGMDFDDYSAAIGARRQLIATGSSDPVFGATKLGQSNIDAMVASIQTRGANLAQQTFTAPDHSVVAAESTWVLDQYDALGAPAYLAPRWTGTLATATDLARIATSLAGYPRDGTIAYAAVDTGGGNGRIDIAAQDHARLYAAAQIATLSGADQTIALAQRGAFTGRT